MGISLSSNRTDSVTRELFNTLNESTVDCRSSINQSQIIKIISDGSINIGKINLADYVSIDTECYTKSKTINKIDQELEKTIAQQARAVTGSLGFGAAGSQNVTRDINSLSDAIKNVYTTRCITNASKEQGIDVEAKGDIDIKLINEQNVLDELTTCSLNDSTVNAAKQRLRDTIDQSSSSTVKGLLDFLGPFVWLIIGIIIFIVALVFIFLLGGGKAVKSIFTSSKIFIVVILILLFIFGYMIIAKPLKFWPYSKVNETDSELEKESKRKRNNRLFIIFIIIEIILLLLLLLFIFLNRRNNRNKSKETDTNQANISGTTDQTTGQNIDTTTTNTTTQPTQQTLPSQPTQT